MNENKRNQLSSLKSIVFFLFISYFHFLLLLLLFSNSLALHVLACTHDFLLYALIVNNNYMFISRLMFHCFAQKFRLSRFCFPGNGIVIKSVQKLPD